jgi:hypothetical protein
MSRTISYAVIVLAAAAAVAYFTYGPNILFGGPSKSAIVAAARQATIDSAPTDEAKKLADQATISPVVTMRKGPDGLARSAAHALPRILERGQLLDADRPPRMHLAGGDADLRAHAELAAVGKLRRGVVQQDGGIDLVEEALRGCRVLGNDDASV